MYLYLFPLIAIVPATIMDQNTSKIPNLITFPFIVAGLAMTAIFNTSFILQCILTVVALFLFGALGLMGLGDIKLLMVIASTCGAWLTVTTIAIASIILLLKELVCDFRNTYLDVVQTVQALFGQNNFSVKKPGKKMPFAIYILMGYALSLVGRLVFYV